MIDEIMSLALGNGIWAALFCFLFLYMLKDSRAREKKYTATIETLSEQLGSATSALNICEKIKADCENTAFTTLKIKHNTESIKEDTESIRTSLERL